MIIAKKLFIYTIVFGIIAFSINMIFGFHEIPYLTTETYNGIQIYKEDFNSYLNNLSLALNQFKQFKLEVPQDTWNSYVIDLITFGIAMVDNLKLILNWLIFLINCLLIPLRIGGNMVIVEMALIGFPINNMTGSTFKWLYDIANFLYSGLQIPLVP